MQQCSLLWRQIMSVYIMYTCITAAMCGWTHALSCHLLQVLECAGSWVGAGGLPGRQPPMPLHTSWCRTMQDVCRYILYRIRQTCWKADGADDIFTSCSCSPTVSQSYDCLSMPQKTETIQNSMCYRAPHFTTSAVDTPLMMCTSCRYRQHCMPAGRSTTQRNAAAVPPGELHILLLLQRTCLKAPAAAASQEPTAHTACCPTPRGSRDSTAADRHHYFTVAECFCHVQTMAIQTKQASSHHQNPHTWLQAGPCPHTQAPQPPPPLLQCEASLGGGQDP